MRVYALLAFCVIAAFGKPIFAVDVVVDVFIIAGQSNANSLAANAASLPAELQEPREDIRFWYDIGDGGDPRLDEHVRPELGTDVWVPLAPQPEWGGRVAFFPPSVSSGHGPELTLGRDLAEASTSEIAIIKYATWGTALHEITEDHPPLPAVDWNVSSGELFDWMVQEVELALSKLESDYGETGRVAGLFWMQGESDAIPPFDLTYETNLQDFVDGVRDQWGPNLPVVIGQISEEIWRNPWGIGFTKDATMNVRMAQASVAERNSFASLVSLDDVPVSSDFLHWNSAGIQEMGRRFANAYLDLSTIELPGDFDQNGILTVTDLELLMREIEAETHFPMLNLDGDTKVDQSDLAIWVKDLKQTYFGDANLDGVFDSADLVTVLAAGEFQDDIEFNSTWATGDWNADEEFTTADLIVAMADGGYELGPRTVPVPEPSCRVLLLGALVCCVRRVRTSTIGGICRPV